MALSVNTRPSGWNAVHLPIIYKLASTSWPTNTVDTARTVLTFTNDNGYTKLTLSGSIKSGVQELEFVKLTVNGTASVYQIYQVFSESQITIDLEYDGGNTFGTCQYYYNNYHAVIRVYAGLRAGHIYNSTKPTALLTTIKAVPDSTGIATVNINEILKSDIDVLGNDLSQASLPNDINAFTEFYIDYAESYDISLDGYTLSTNTTSFTSDSANYAIAVNSKLPFKNGSGGVMTAYTQNGVMKFLTLFERPRLFDGQYYDLSFIRVKAYLFTTLRRVLEAAGVQLATSYDALPDIDEGVYRHVISRQTTEDTIRIQGGATQSILAPSSWSDGTGTWTAKTATQFQKVALTGNVSAYQTINYANGDTPPPITVTLTLTPNLGATVGVTFAFYTTYGGTVVSSDSFSTASSYSAPRTFTFPAISGGSATILQITAFASPGNADVFIDITDFVGDLYGWVAATEEKTIDVDTACTNQEIYITWKNYLGEHDYWKFTAQKEYGVDVEEVTSAEKNILVDWPDSYNDEAITYETSRKSRDTVIVRSQNLTLQQVQGLKFIRTSSLVQVVTGTENVPVLRNILVDQDSFTLYQDGDKLYTFEFAFRYTDMIPNQSL